MADALTAYQKAKATQSLKDWVAVFRLMAVLPSVLTSEEEKSKLVHAYEALQDPQWVIDLGYGAPEGLIETGKQVAQVVAQRLEELQPQYELGDPCPNCGCREYVRHGVLLECRVCRLGRRG